LSFREFINFTTKKNFPIINFSEIINNHEVVATKILEDLKPLALFNDYLVYGYYPFFKSDKEFFNQRLLAIINMVIEIEMPLLRGVSVAKIQKNSNLAYALARGVADKGNVRETFFLNQLKYLHQVNYPDKADFIVDEKYYFEVGGRSKSQKQIEGLENAFVVSDDIEVGYDNKIPLWMFGFMY